MKAPTLLFCLFRAGSLPCAALALALAVSPVRAADAAAADATPAAPATAATAPATGNATPPTGPRPRLPLDFANFAPDYVPKDLRQDWLSVEIGELETFNGPPPNMPSFVMPAEMWDRQQMSVTFKPIALTCVVGSKARFENLMMIDVDKANNPLGYSLPLGQLVYFLATRETPEGMVFSIHYYHADELRWIPSSGGAGTFLPVTSPIILTQDAVMQVENYAFFYLSQRMTTVVPNTPTPAKALYKFLVVHIHRLSPPSAPPPTSLALPAGS